MKRYLLPVLFFASCLMASGELSKKELKKLRDVEIAGVSEDTIRNEDREKIETLEVSTFHNEEDDGEGFRIHIVVELMDKAKNLYIVDFTGNRPGDLDVEYTGEDYWTLHMPHGVLERPKITGYAVQYGFMDDKKFILLDEKYDDVKTLEELTERTTTLFPGKIQLKYYYMYDDENEGETESMSRTVRRIVAKTKE